MEAPQQRSTPEAAVPQLTEHLFRHEAGKLVSMLTGIFGTRRLQMAEDVVQEALVRALQTWPYYGIPQNPPAWLMQTAKNLALDLLRREKNFLEKEPAIVTTMEQQLSGVGGGEPPQFADEMKDGQLRLMFACCHPALPPEAQTALALRTLCGLSPSEIASAFLITEVAVTKRLTRARQRLQEAEVPFEIPAGPELSSRLAGVLQILYLLFNEGYKATGGEHLVRADLCFEAIQLATLLAEHPTADQPRTHALLAMMHLSAARLPTRHDLEGNLLRLRHQDRARWDRRLIALGMQHLRRAAGGEELSVYHLQAGIAACHATAADYASTDWPAILAHYDRWLEMSDSAVVALNRAVALAEIEGPEAGIRTVETIRIHRHLEGYYLIYAVLGDFEAQLGHWDQAAAYFRQGLMLAKHASEQKFLAGRMQECLTASMGT